MGEKKEKHFGRYYFGSVQHPRDISEIWQCPSLKMSFYLQKKKKNPEIEKRKKNVIRFLSSRGLNSSSGTVSGSTSSALLTVQPEQEAFSSTHLNLGTFPTYSIL